jgi:hypothetical protein
VWEERDRVNTGFSQQKRALLSRSQQNQSEIVDGVGINRKGVDNNNDREDSTPEQAMESKKGT